MYLNRHIFVWTPERKALKITGLKNEIKTDKVKYIIEEALYWRKVNSIHNWFVENVQDGVDECQEVDVDTDKLKELLETIKKVLADHSLAKELLPTGERFFFGSTDYDEWYWKDLENTVKPLEECIADERGWYQYCSSW